MYIVGTAVRNVIFSLFGSVGMLLALLGGMKGAPSLFQTAVGLNGNRNSIDEPANNGARMALTTPWMWWRGIKWSSRSSGEYSHASTKDWVCADRADCGRKTPFYHACVNM